MNPPIRDSRHKKVLRQALKKNDIDLIGSDHAPHLKSEKKLPYPKSPSGMPGVQTLLPVLLNEVHKKTISLNYLVRLTSFNVIKIFKIKNKGLIKEGFDADFSIVDLNKKMKFSNSMVNSKCGWSPFHGTQFNGWPVGTIINGNKVFWNGKLIGKPDGKPIKFN